MIKTVSTSWPLFFGLALMMVANGLQGTLLGLRASIEGFETITIGIIMSLYYLGFLVGSHYAPKLITTVGHIRVFTALASLASTTVLFHGLSAEPFLWIVIRFFTGFAYAGLYIVVESWLNDQSTNKTRGKIFGIYQFISFGGMVIGQYILALADPAEITLFVITSVLVSIALLPISLSARPAPAIEEPETMSLKRLFVISPLGMAGVFLVGMGTSAIFSLGAVYGQGIGMTIPQISTFMAVYIAGGVVSQIPIGWLSDRFDRRLILIGVSAITAVVSFLCWSVSDSPYILNAVVFALGMISLPIYGLSMAQINDHLTPRQFVGASAAGIMVNGMGAASGPFIISFFMSILGTGSFFPTIGTVFVVLTIYGLYRMTKREAVPMDKQGDYTSMPLRATPLTMTITEEGHQIQEDIKKDIPRKTVKSKKS